MVDCRDGKSVHWLTLAHFFAGYSHPWCAAAVPTRSADDAQAQGLAARPGLPRDARVLTT